MKILVTGGAGFIGSAVVDAYIDNGHRVTVVDDESSGIRTQVNPKAAYFKLNICNRLSLRRLFKKHKFDVVSHHAAQIDVRRSVADPIFDANVNILGILNVLEECRHRNVKKIIFSSSGGTVYGECSRPAKETDPEVPLSPYGVAKLASEKYIQTYAALHGLRFTIFRYANVFGPRQDPHGEAGVVAIFSRNLLEKRRSFIFGTGRQTRDFVYVKDVARANVLALNKGTNRILNIGTKKMTSVKSLYSTMASLVGDRSGPLFKKARIGELNNSVLHFGRAQTELGWRPATPLREGLLETIEYFRSSMVL